MEIFNDIILKTETLNSATGFKKEDVDIHIAFGIDRNFARGMGICITSMILNHGEKNMVFHIFTDYLDETDVEKLTELLQYKNVEIKIYYIDSKIFKNLPTTMAWSEAIYYRFIMGNSLYGSVDKVLYVDADILCVGSLDELQQLDMQDNIIVAIEDNFAASQERMEYLGIKNSKYFNSGVMYIDINKWNDAKIAEKSLDLLIKNPEKYKSFDQDVLNILLDGRTYFLDEKWNYIYNLGYMTHTIPSGLKLIHFTGDKPWQQWTAHHPMVEIYGEYMKKSPWDRVPLTKPVHYKEKRRMAKSHGKRGHYIKALLWYCQYLWARTQIKQKSK